MGIPALPRVSLAIASLALVIVLPGAADADIAYDLTTQFDVANNPSSLGPWRYGWSATLGGTFSQFSSQGAYLSGSVPFWAGSGSSIAAKNTTASSQQDGTIHWLPGQTTAHPGQNGEYAIFRFTAPNAGLYEIDALFSGNDDFGTTTDVHVLLNSISLFSGAVNSAWSGGLPGAGPTFSSAPLSLLAGDTIDFAVGRGSNNTYINDTTGISGQVTAVPEAAAFSMMCSVAALAIATRLRREWTVARAP
jgi:hypothetical protein